MKYLFALVMMLSLMGCAQQGTKIGQYSLEQNHYQSCYVFTKSADCANDFAEMVEFENGTALLQTGQTREDWLLYWYGIAEVGGSAKGKVNAQRIRDKRSAEREEIRIAEAAERKAIADEQRPLAEKKIKEEDAATVRRQAAANAQKIKQQATVEVEKAKKPAAYKLEQTSAANRYVASIAPQYDPTAFEKERASSANPDMASQYDPTALVSEDNDLRASQDIASCVPVMTHASQVARANGMEDMAIVLDGAGLGAMIAAEQSLRNGGYNQDYIDASLPGWVESYMISFKYKNTGDAYFAQEMERCSALNSLQAQLVNQWRMENGK